MDALVQSRELVRAAGILDALRDGTFLAPYDAFLEAARERRACGQCAIRDAAQSLASELARHNWTAMHRDLAGALIRDALWLADLACRQLSIMQDV